MENLHALGSLDATVAPPRDDTRQDARLASTRALLLRHESAVRRLVRHLLGPRGEVDDVVHDVFVRLITKSKSLRDPDRESAWVTRVTVNLVRNHLRSARVRRIVELRPRPPEVEHCSEPELLGRDLARRGYALLDRLRPNDRIALLLRRAEGRTVQDVARICNCSVATVKRRVQRADRELSNLLADDDDLREQILGSARHER